MALTVRNSTAILFVVAGLSLFLAGIYKNNFTLVVAGIVPVALFGLGMRLKLIL
jgi:hypothetical protein